MAMLGMAIVAAGFIYDIMFAGIPYQDPTPEMQARWEFHANIAFWIISAGGIIFCLGLMLIPFLTRKK